jgi:hypothetical protein
MYSAQQTHPHPHPHPFHPEEAKQIDKVKTCSLAAKRARIAELVSPQHSIDSGQVKTRIQVWKGLFFGFDGGF